MTLFRLGNLSVGFLGSALLMAQYGPEQSIPQEGPRSVVVTDMDNDGDKDVLIASRSGLQVLINTNGSGSLSVPVFVSTTDAIGQVGDVDGDGYPDVVGSNDMDGGIFWYRNLGTFGYAGAQTIDAAATAEAIVPGDADGDGDLDLIVALENNTLQWSENTDGLGTFGPLAQIAFASNVKDLQLLDLDTDGDLDLSWSTTATDEVYWNINTDGAGTFGPSALLSNAGRGIQADIDGDGRADLGMVNDMGGQAVWQRRDAGGVTFGMVRSIESALDQPGAMLVNDLDGDGDMDLALTSLLTDEVMWYENLDGQGSFGPRQVIGAGVDGAEVLAAGDLDNDGDLELFTASASQQRVVRYDNLANATDMIVGRVFNDQDTDGAFNGTDHGLYNVPVTIPGVGTTFTNHAGVYWFAVPSGTYTVNASAPSGWDFVTPSALNVVLGSPNNGSHENDFALHANTTIHEVEAQLTNAPTRCGMDIQYWITVNNIGNQVDDLHLTLDLEDLSGFVSAEPAPTSTGAGMQTWIFEAVQPTHHRQVVLTVHLPDAAHMGEILHDALHVEAWQGGSMAYQATFTNEPVLECAFDPNDKLVHPQGEGQGHLVPIDQQLTYTVRFQNTGTIPAENVIIVDQLDADLDPATVQVIGASHPMHALVSENGEITFEFLDIQLPDSGSNEAASHGYVQFTVSPLGSLPDLTPVHNTASIYFDANPAIVTNTTLSTLSYGVTGVHEAEVNGDAFIQVQPNPAFDMATIHIGSALQGRVTIDVYDEAGQRVIRLIRNTNTIIIHREDMPAGVYLLRATDENGREAMTRLIWGR